MFRAFKDIDKLIKEKKIAVKYPAGYKQWKKKFDASFSKTHNVSKTLDELHGKTNK